MRLKSNHILPLLLLLTLAAACSQDDDDTACAQGEIRFSGSSLAPVVTRGSTETLPSDYLMWVAAVCHDQYNANHTYYFGPSIEKKFVWDGGFTAWKGVEDHFYPLSGTMDFLAYAIQNDDHKPTATYTPAALSPGANTITSLALDFGTTLDGTDAVVFSDLRPGAPCGSGSTLQHLLFRHAMAKVQFMTRADNATTATHFTLHRVTVKGARTSGRLLITAAPTTEVTIEGKTAMIGSTATWTHLYGAARDLSSYSSSTGMHPLLSATESVMVGTPLYVPTQSAGDMDIEIEYTITNNGTTTGHLTKAISLGATNWEMGKQYSYTLVVSLTQIYVETNIDGAVIDSTPVDIDLDEKYHGTTPV